MRSIFDPHFGADPWTVTPSGTSPFRARGLVYHRELARIESTTPGGVEAVLARITDPAVAKYCRGQFRALDWYDIVPIAIAARVSARVRKIPFTQYAREAGQDYAASVVEGVSGVVFHALSLATIASWMPRLSAWFNDFGDVQTTKIGPGQVRVMRTGLPQYLVQGWAITAADFTEEVLRRVGATSARAHPLAVEPDGERGGIELYRVAFDLRWDAPE